MAPRSTRSMAARDKRETLPALRKLPANSSARVTRLRSSAAGTAGSDESLAESSPANPFTSELPSRRILKEVAIPTMASPSLTGSAYKGLKVSDPVPRSETSGSRTRDTSTDYETPATSIAPTPAGFPSGRRKNPFSTGAVAESSSKRKRPTRFGGMAVSMDEELARALQEKEYSAGSFKKAKTASQSSRQERHDGSDRDSNATVEDTSELSEPESDLNWRSDDDAPTFKGKGKARLTDGRRTTRLQRAAVRRDMRQDSVSTSALPFGVHSEDDSNAGNDQTASQNPGDSTYESSVEIVTEATDFESDDDEPLANRTGFALPAVTLPSTGYSRYDSFAQRVARRRDARRYRDRAKLEKSHPNIKTMWDELEAIPLIPREKAKQPDSITRTLKSFQLEGLNWMQKQEQTHYKGGLLGDEMGMGKTIQAVSLIMSDFPAKDPTLVVVPPVALMQWRNEIDEYTNGKLKVLVYHGAKSKTYTVKHIKEHNVVMITYQSLESLYRKESKGWVRQDDIIKADSLIHSIHWHRLILDEAHSIKQRTTGVAKACFALKGTYKWCLSGTPVQNRIGEFFSLLRFLEVRPFADYFCRSCDCAQLHWSLDTFHRCTHCQHSGAEHVSVFNQELLNPITQVEDPALREGGLNKLKLLTDHIMLRRMKRDHTSSLELPPKEVILHNEFFGEIERDFSSSIMTNTTRQFDTYVSRGVMLNNYANIFGLIMQMRQVADHPDLLLKRHAEGGQNILVCNICDEPAEEAVRSRCRHEFCRSCIKGFVKACEGAGGTPDCPRCHIPLSIDFDQPDIEQDEELVKKNSIINRIKMENWTSSTKIEMLIYDLYKLRSRRHTFKSIVFSQFTSMLQLIELRLRRAGINTVMLDGSMTPVQRQRSIDYFMKNVDVEVFLVSLKAGGVALNLTEASRVYIVDPWWNPAAEWQSADRCHRIGQRRPCVITRLCIEDSVESRMVLLQEKKANMINGTINNDKVSMDKLTPEDLQFLFRGS